MDIAHWAHWALVLIWVILVQIWLATYSDITPPFLFQSFPVLSLYSPLNKGGKRQVHTTVKKKFFFFLEDITFIQQGPIKLIKSDIKDKFCSIFEFWSNKCSLGKLKKLLLNTEKSYRPQTFK